jgi:hypothetical protein
MRMSGLCKVEMSASMEGRGPHGSGANHFEPTRTGPIESVDYNDRHDLPKLRTEEKAFDGLTKKVALPAPDVTQLKHPVA